MKLPFIGLLPPVRIVIFIILLVVLKIGEVMLLPRTDQVSLE